MSLKVKRSGEVERRSLTTAAAARDFDGVSPQHRKLRRERSATTAGEHDAMVDRVGLLQMIQRNICDMTSTAALAVPTATGKLEASAPIVLDDVTTTSTGTSRGPSRRVRSSLTTSYSIRTAWRMRYQDFVPEGWSVGGNSDSFQKLVDSANDWLKRNKEMHVKTCETITWTSHDQKSLGDSESMLLSRRIAENASNYALRGLRLWVVPRAVNKPQHICFSDFVPSDPEDSIQSLVAAVNSKIHQNHLKGQIVTIETVAVPIINNSVDGSITAWKECADRDSPYVFALRVFYNREVNGRIYGTERAQIGIKDVIPLPTDQTYEGFDDLIEHTNVWLKQQADLLVTNFQSVIVQKNNAGPHSETGSACFFTHPGVNRPLPVDYFRILRVAYLKPMGDLLVDLPVLFPLTFETFTPEIVRNKEFGSCGQKERLEKMTETFSKVTSFLQNSGADLICAETVSNPMQFYPQDNVHVLPANDEMKFLFTIRLYLSGRIHRVVDGSTRSNKRSSVASGNRSHGNSTEADNEHPGPIFLRHVVNRRFKYRWLILAITAITCMTIVVIVSVVYSNL